MTEPGAVAPRVGPAATASSKALVCLTLSFVALAFAAVPAVLEGVVMARGGALFDRYDQPSSAVVEAVLLCCALGYALVAARARGSHALRVGLRLGIAGAALTACGSIVQLCATVYIEERSNGPSSALAVLDDFETIVKVGLGLMVAGWLLLAIGAAWASVGAPGKDRGGVRDATVEPTDGSLAPLRGAAVALAVALALFSVSPAAELTVLVANPTNSSSWLFYVIYLPQGAAWLCIGLALWLAASSSRPLPWARSRTRILPMGVGACVGLGASAVLTALLDAAVFGGHPPTFKGTLIKVIALSALVGSLGMTAASTYALADSRTRPPSVRVPDETLVPPLADT